MPYKNQENQEICFISLCNNSNYSEHFGATKGCLTLSYMKLQPDKNSHRYCSLVSNTKTLFALHFALRNKKDYDRPCSMPQNYELLRRYNVVLC